jgi:uncharacterized protein
MSNLVLNLAATRIGEHVRRHAVPAVHIVLHGGEPLLAGAERLASAARAVRDAVPAGVQVDVRVQTNGTLLEPRVLDTFVEAGILVGVSVDGDRAAHDRHRRGPDGGGSFPAVERALGLLCNGSYRTVFAGVLAAVDLANDPLTTYEALARFAPPAMDLLLPHANWSNPPPQGSFGDASTPYADWLITVFDHWYAAPVQPVRIRLFEEIIRMALGYSGRTEYLGLSPADVVVIETDGTIEQVDTLKSAFHGAASTGCDLARHSFDDVLDHPAIAVRQGGVSALCATCRKCPIMDICGGGYYAHRFRQGTGFHNPSVYCRDLQALIGHIVRAVRRDLRAAAPST